MKEPSTEQLETAVHTKINGMLDFLKSKKSTESDRRIGETIDDKLKDLLYSLTKYFKDCLLAKYL